MLNRSEWKVTVDADLEQASPYVVAAPLPRKSRGSKPASSVHPRNIPSPLPFEDLKDKGGPRLCGHPECGIKCEVHCLQCAQQVASHTNHLTLPPLSCQLCHLLWSPSCPQPDSPRVEDINNVSASMET